VARVWASARALAYCAKGSEVNPQYHKKYEEHELSYRYTSKTHNASSPVYYGHYLAKYCYHLVGRKYLITPHKFHIL
jgi:hypothetical protein